MANPAPKKIQDRIYYIVVVSNEYDNPKNWILGNRLYTSKNAANHDIKAEKRWAREVRLNVKFKYVVWTVKTRDFN